MKNFINILFIIIFTSTFSVAQSLNSRVLNNDIDLNSLSKEFDLKFKNDLEKAKKLNIKLIDTLGKDKLLYLNSFTKEGEPLYLTNFSTTNAGKNVRINSLYLGGDLGLNLDGSSTLIKDKLGMWDGGNVNSNHQEMTGRVQNLDSSPVSEHSSHVAGIMIASGINKDVRGMAFKANLKAWNFTNDISEITANAKNLDGSPKLLITNHSYGYQAGWAFDSNVNKWRWYGNTTISKTKDYKFGQYDNSSASLDRLAFNAPYLLMVKSAGNNRDSNGPTNNETYYLGSGTDTSTVSRSPNNSYDIISTTGNAKNILTVGAVNMNYRFPFLISDIKMSDYSSWGPTDDGRIKPDLVGVGTNLLSIFTGTNDYQLSTGTSMSSPNVAGSLLLLQELYTNLNNDYLKGATLKGIALHTSLDIIEKGPDYQSGWGLLDMKEAAKLIQNNGTKSLILEDKLLPKGIKSLDVIASGDGNLEASISWYDPAAEEQGSVLDDKTKKLINDLDIRIQDKTTSEIFLPFILDPAKPANPATNGDNVLDNFEKIIIPKTIPGRTYTITVNHKKDTLKNNYQDYSLIISGIGGVEGSYPNLSFSSPTNHIDSVVIQNIKNPSEYINSEIGGKDSLSIYFNNSNSKSIVFLVDWNNDGDFNDAQEKVFQNNNYTSNLFSTNIQLPKDLNLQENKILRSRLLVSNSTITDINSTSFSSGELKEYLFKLIPSSNDLSIVDLNQSGGEFCPTNGNSNFYAKVKNLGTKDRVEYKVKLSVLQGNTVIKTTTTDLVSILRGTENEVQINTDLLVLDGQSYNYKAEIVFEEDQNLLNNTFEITKTINNSSAPVTQGFSCTGTEDFILKSLDGKTVNWSDDTNFLGIGETFKATNITNPKAYIGGVNFGMGPISKDDFGGGTYYENFGPAPIFNVSTPIILEKARIYTADSGKIYFDLYNFDSGELITSISKDVPKTRILTDTNRVNNQIPGDPNDPGIEINLNLQFPKAGKYVLFQTCTEGSNIYRSNIPKDGSATLPSGGNIGFPYSKNGIINLEGSYYNGEVIKTGYYYYYDMKFISPGCKSDIVDVPLTASTPPTVSINSIGVDTVCGGSTGDTLRISNISAGATGLWFLNDASTGNTSDSILTKTEGIYKLVATNQDGCSTSSDTYQLTIDRPETPKLTLNSGKIIASYGSSFQWYQDGFPIDGATEKEYLVLETGNYFVVIKNDKGCSAKSASYDLTIMSTPLNEPVNSFNLYPNPSKGNLTISIPDDIAKKGYSFKIFDATGGIKLEKNSIINTNKISLDINELSPGLYFLMVPEMPTNKVIKFIKE